jgi:hypothetical protein
MWETAALNDKAERLRAEQGVSTRGHELMTKSLVFSNDVLHGY